MQTFRIKKQTQKKQKTKHNNKIFDIFATRGSKFWKFKIA